MEGKQLDEHVTFKTALLAHSKGFHSDNGYFERSYFTPTGQERYLDQDYAFDDQLDETTILCPTQSRLQRWLREVHKIRNLVEDAECVCNVIDKWIACIDIPENDCISYVKCEDDEDRWKLFDTYEEALEVALYENMKLLK